MGIGCDDECCCYCYCRGSDVALDAIVIVLDAHCVLLLVFVIVVILMVMATIVLVRVNILNSYKGVKIPIEERRRKPQRRASVEPFVQEVSGSGNVGHIHSYRHKKVIFQSQSPTCTQLESAGDTVSSGSTVILRIKSLFSWMYCPTAIATQSTPPRITLSLSLTLFRSLTFSLSPSLSLTRTL